jgi:TGF-beta propeptide
MKSMRKMFLAIMEMALIVLTACEKEEAVSKGFISFSLQDKTEQQQVGLRNATVSEPCAVLITLKDDKGNCVLNGQKYSIVESNGEYWVQNIELASGEYTIEEFLVVDDSDNVIYIAPKLGSEMAPLVNNPLPFSFIVTGGESTNVSLEVLDSDLGSLSEFGYVSFPLSIYKTRTLQPGAEEGKDAHVEYHRPDLNASNYPYMLAVAWTINGELALCRSFIEFDLSDIPAGSTIAKARLSLYEYHTELSATSGHYHEYGSNAFVVRQVTAPWREDSITWNTQPTATNERRVIIPQDTISTQDYLNIDVTAIVQSWVNNPGSNYGFMFKLVEEQPYRTVELAFSDCAIAEKRPKLVISYK